MQLLSGRWAPLTDHGARGELRGVALALSSAGVFLGVVADDGPRLLHGRISGETIT